MHNYEIWFTATPDPQQAEVLQERIEDIAHGSPFQSINIGPAHLFGKVEMVAHLQTLTLETDERFEGLERLLAEWDIPHIATLDGQPWHVLDPVVSVPDDGG